MSNSLFNQEILDFRFFPKNALITESVINEYNSMPISKKRANLIRYLFDGIRMNPNSDDEEEKFLCVICDEKFVNFEEVTNHIAAKHQEPLDMLRNTPCQPVVGLDLIVENRNDNNDIVEYECSICSVFLHQKMIFWHVISFPHKEQFFKSKYPTQFKQLGEDPTSRHDKIDQQLINHEKKLPDRGNFVYRLFERGMIESVNNFQSRLNMSYIRKMYPTETLKLNQLYQKEEQVVNPLRDSLDIAIQNNEQFDQGKELLQKMNKALLEYNM